MTWDMIIGKYLLKDKATPPGKSEWRKWLEMKTWMNHASFWWAEVLDEFGYTIEDRQRGSGKTMEDA